METARAGGCSPVIVVVRTGGVVDADTVVVNPEPDRGLASSLALGLAAAEAAAAGPVLERALILLVDQPGITAAVIARMLAAPPGPGLSFAHYGDRRGHPVRVDRRFWVAVAAAAQGDCGARAFAHSHPELVAEVDCAGLGDPTDLDTAAELAAWSGSRSGSGGAAQQENRPIRREPPR